MACVIAKPDKNSVIAIVIPDKDNCKDLVEKKNPSKEEEERLLESQEGLEVDILNCFQGRIWIYAD